jgi:ribosomal protein S18 acetylase RimI-like enzyme
MPPPHLRRAQPEDAALLAGLAHRAYLPYVARIGRRPGPMDTDYDLAVAQDEVWMAVIGDELAGFVVLRPEDENLLLENIAVDPAFQGRGVGRTLLDLVEQRADGLGLDGIRLYTHAMMTENQRIYERRGYVETERVHEDGFDRLFYRKDLRRSRGTRMPNT